jgi:hypothetical protein
MHPARFALIAALLLFPGTAFGQSAESEPAAILELGAAGSLNVKNGDSSFGPSVAVEVTPIKNWLEIEAGVTPLFRRHATEWDTDVIFKKPWTLSRKVEFMAGIGPEWVHSNDHGVKTNSVAGEAALDFMFWPLAKHKFGWYLEPAYDYSFSPGHEQSAGITGGLLIAIP